MTVGRQILRLFSCIALACVGLALVALTAAQRMVGEGPWWVELSRYLPYYWLLLPCTVVLALSFWLGRAWVALGLANLCLLGTLTMGLEWHSGGPGGARVRVMTFNVKALQAVHQRQGLAALAREVARHDPDILVMQDANGLLVERDPGALRGGPPVFGLANVYASGQYVVASRLPLRGCVPGQIGFRDQSHRYLRCIIDVGGVDLTVVTAHFQSPRTGLNAARREGLEGADEWQQNYRDRLEQSHALARDMAGVVSPLVVAGDLNAPEASPVVGNLLATGLRDAFSAAGKGYGYTYGHHLRYGLAFLRIDHILVSTGIRVSNCFAGEGRASDHRPVIADLILQG